MNKYIIALGILGLSVTNATLAQNEKEPYAVNFAADSITVNTSLGWLDGESNEYAYDPNSGQKVSELIWKINNAVIIKGDIPGIHFFG